MRLTSILSLLLALTMTATANANPIPFDDDKPKAPPPKCEASNVRREGERCVECKHRVENDKECDTRFENTPYHFRCDTKGKAGVTTELWCGKVDKDK